MCAIEPPRGTLIKTHEDRMPLTALIVAVLAAVSPISIVAPERVVAGGTLCFDVVSVDGIAAVLVEVNEVAIPVTRQRTDDPSVTTVCCKVPAGAAGSSIVITAVSASGAVATAVVLVAQ